VHASSFAIPPTGNTPLSVMVHDLAWRNVADAYPAHGRRWHEKALRRALARAAILMVPSNETADDLLRSGAPASRVEVVEEGSDHLPPPDHESAGELLRELDVDGEYLLTASTLEPRKNLGGLIAAYESVIGQLPEPWPLVVVGPTGWGDSRASATAGSRPVYRRITRVGGVPSANESRIVPTGYVSDAVLAALYARARLMAYVPHKEGFGLPVLEAMRAGAPVVASPVPSAGGATFEVDPTDIDSIARGLVDVATDENLRQQLIDAGHQRASKLTWKRAAERHVELWNAMAANRPR
jgi:glycosyltransferase involved in cell wall biosynthesis